MATPSEQKTPAEVQADLARIAAEPTPKPERLLSSIKTPMDAPILEEYNNWYNLFELRDGEKWASGPVAVIRHPYKGRCLVAARDLVQGESLIAAQPYAWSVNEKLKQKVCRYCLRDGEEVLPHKCGKCQQVYYCSIKCKLADEMVHIQGGECRMMIDWEIDHDVYTQDTVGEMKMLLRCLATKTAEKLPGFTLRAGQLLYDDYIELIAGVEDFGESLREALSFWVCDYMADMRKWMGFPQDTSKECMEIVLRNRRNSFYIASIHSSEPVGCGVYVTPSFFNHSCSPNVFYQSYPTAHEPREFEYCAQENLPMGTELSISYLDDISVVLPCAKRREMLMDGFLFKCSCVRCLRADEGEDDGVEPPAEAAPASPEPATATATPAAAAAVADK